MKVIFLDIDGVLNSTSWFISEYYLGCKASESIPPIKINREKLGLLKYIIDKTDAKIVISSVWRYNRLISEFREIFEEFGWKSAPVIDITPRFNEENRGREIDHWLRKHKVRNFAIIDDDSDMTEEQITNGHFFQTDTREGLTYKTSQEIIEFLGCINN